jgi:predicted metallopeptidase
MANITISDAYTTVSGAASSAVLGADTIKADNLILVAHKASKTENTGTVYFMKTGGAVRIPLEPGDVMSLVSPGDEELTLDQFTIENVNAGDGVGYLAIEHSPYD